MFKKIFCSVVLFQFLILPITTFAQLASPTEPAPGSYIDLFAPNTNTNPNSPLQSSVDNAPAPGSYINQFAPNPNAAVTDATDINAINQQVIADQQRIDQINLLIKGKNGSDPDIKKLSDEAAALQDVINLNNKAISNIWASRAAQDILKNSIGADPNATASSLQTDISNLNANIDSINSELSATDINSQRYLDLRRDLINTKSAIAYRQKALDALNQTNNTGIQDSSNNSVTATLQNPLQFESLQELIFGAINIVLKFAYVFIAFAIIWAGFKLITAQGKPKEIEDAKRGITWTLIGAAIIIGANVIASVLQNTISSFTK